MDTREKRLAYAAWAAVCFFWGTGYLAIRIGVADTPPLLFAGLRILAAGALLTGWLVLRGVSLPKGRDWGRLTLVGLALEGVANGVLAWSAQWVPSGMLALLIAVTPFWMVGLEAVLPGGERVTRQMALGLALGFGGLVWLLAPRLPGISPDAGLALGSLMVQVVCLSYAAGSIYARRRPALVKPLMGAGIQMLAAGAALVAAGSIAGEWGRFRLEGRAAGAFVYLLLFGSLLGYSSYVYALQKLPLSVVSLHRYINPAVAVLLGWAVLGETLGPSEVAAVAVIFAGVLVVQRSQPKPSP